MVNPRQKEVKFVVTGKTSPCEPVPQSSRSLEEAVKLELILFYFIF